MYLGASDGLEVGGVSPSSRSKKDPTSTRSSADDALINCTLWENGWFRAHVKLAPVTSMIHKVTVGQRVQNSTNNCSELRGQCQATAGGQQAPVAAVAVDFSCAPLTELVCATFTTCLVHTRTRQGGRERRVSWDGRTEGGRGMMLTKTVFDSPPYFLLSHSRRTQVKFLRYSM